MRIKHVYFSSSQSVTEITLENEVERKLSDSDLLLIADNGRGITFDHKTKSYSLNGESFGNARHFGGTVDRSGDHCKVTVWTD